ncbi:MAG: hypothetical protein Q9O24_06905 [Gammaproteobacteria bacterium]|nr:hypothetical protein [Gammaproteobacteria bacterium]
MGARNKKRFNASFIALNLLKLEDRKDKNNPEPSVISIASWRRKKFNQYLMKILFDKLGLDNTSDSFREKKIGTTGGF